MDKLSRQDIEEVRVKCDVCGYELTYPEYLFAGNKCIFHTDDKTRQSLSDISVWNYIRHALNEFQVMRGKIEMQKRNLTHVDYQACVNEVGEELHTIDSKGLITLVNYMKAHGRA